MKQIAEAKQQKAIEWPEQYRNSETGKLYKPHHQEEIDFVNDRSSRYLLAKGGEGGGKSVVGIIRDLNRIRVGASGIMVSPDFEHFKKSLWPEFRRWCPWEFVVSKQRYRESFDWEPSKPFQLAFTTGAIVYCGGMKEQDVMAWEGPNVNWAHFDECRRHKTAAALKVLDGRVRIPVGGFHPQLWLTTTPKKHWLFEFFGPILEKDPKESFKRDALVMTLLTADNLDNLTPDFVTRRRQTLTEAEARVLLDAEWEDIEDTEYFLPSMSLWDLCQEELPPLGKKEPMVLALDAAKGRQQGIADCFGMVGVTRHPEHHDDVAVRFVQKWQARTGTKMDYKAEDGPIPALLKLCAEFDVVMVAYDPYQLHSVATDLNNANVAWFFEFSQGSRRLEADRQLLDLVLQRRLTHNGDSDLREHIQNSNRKFDTDGRRLRIIQREDALKIDLSVCLSMACFEALRLNI